MNILLAGQQATLRVSHTIHLDIGRVRLLLPVSSCHLAVILFPRILFFVPQSILSLLPPSRYLFRWSRLS